MKPITQDSIKQILLALQEKESALGEHTEYAIRDEAALERCLSLPFIREDGRSVYSGSLEKMCFLFFLIVKERPFEKQNAKIAFVVLCHLLRIENYWIAMDSYELFRVVQWISASPLNAKEPVIEYMKKMIKGNAGATS